MTATTDDAFFRSLTSADSARFGEADAPPPAAGPPAGGGGGGGANPAAAVGAIMSGAAALTGAITGAVMAGRETETRPDIMAHKQVKRLGKAISGLQRCQREYTQAKKVRDAAVAWLRHPAHKEQWMTGGPAMSIAPPGLRTCPPLIPNVPGEPARPSHSSPGGHAIASPGCGCKTALCAYRPRVRPQVHLRSSEAALYTTKMRNIKEGGALRGAGEAELATPMAKNRGSIEFYRYHAKIAWSFLISLEGFREVLFAAGMPVLWKSADMTAPATIKAIFPDEVGASEGIIPARIGQDVISGALAMYGQGMLPASYPPPLWAYGFSEGDRDRIGTGPNISQLATIQADMYGQGSAAPSFSGVRFGAGDLSGVTSLRGRITELILNNQHHSIRSSPPSVLPGATASHAPVWSPEQQSIIARSTARADSWWTPGKIVGAVSGTTALLGTIFFAIKMGRA